MIDNLNGSWLSFIPPSHLCVCVCHHFLFVFRPGPVSSSVASCYPANNTPAHNRVTQVLTHTHVHSMCTCIFDTADSDPSPSLCVSECSSCPRESVQKCVCGREETQRPCASPQWNCKQVRHCISGTTTSCTLEYYCVHDDVIPAPPPQVCGSVLSCGNHTCEVVCHSGACPPCPRSVSRSCPCGKTSETHTHTR